MRIAKLLMIAAAVNALVSFGGAMILSQMGESEYAWLWIAFGLINIFIYWINLRTYRKFNPR